MACRSDQSLVRFRDKFMPANPHDQNHVGVQFRNLILSALSEPCLSKLAPHLQSMELPQGSVLVQTDRPNQWIYLLEHGMCSMTSLNAAGTPVEVGIIGREGIVGVHSLLGQPKTQMRLIMQGAGAGLRVRADAMRSLLDEFDELLLPLHTFLYVLLEQTTQLILCNRLHSLESRLARWLLMTSDFMETSALRLTQEYLAEMLGVGRPAVTIAAGVLQRAGIIVYSRGFIEIVDRSLLRQGSCECYAIIQGTYSRVYPSLF
jgi:CRP-like cAMP-binding protein